MPTPVESNKMSSSAEPSKIKASVLTLSCSLCTRYRLATQMRRLPQPTMGRQGSADLHHAVIVGFQLKGLWYGALIWMHIQGPGAWPDLSRVVTAQALLDALQNVPQLHSRMHIRHSPAQQVSYQRMPCPPLYSLDIRSLALQHIWKEALVP